MVEAAGVEPVPAYFITGDGTRLPTIVLDPPRNLLPSPSPGVPCSPLETLGRRFLSEGTPYGSGSGLLWPGSLPQQRLSGQVPPDELSRRDNVDALKSRGSQKSAVPGHDAGSLTRDRAREEHQVVWVAARRERDRPSLHDPA